MFSCQFCEILRQLLYKTTPGNCVRECCKEIANFEGNNLAFVNNYLQKKLHLLSLMTSVMPIQTKFMLCLEKCIFGVFISFSFCIWCFQFESINICRSFKFLTIHGNLSVNTEKSDKREFLVTASLSILQVFF